MAEFADHALLRVQAGHGGNGCASVHREKFKPLGGPDGGNGGRGGSVILEVDASSSTLLDFHRRPVRKADNGRQGEGSNRNGAAGEDLTIKVPNGTVVLSNDGEVLADLVGTGTQFIAAAGGRGGLGNAALASARRKAPGFALKGEPGDERELVLELKAVADIGLIGFPNAGKSSLIAAMSAARPKIADYPFTTLIPNLGVVEAGDVQYVVADVPGLIPGASEGKGLGHDFLKHVERCSALVHVLDCATDEPGRDPISDLDTIEAELARYEEIVGVGLAGTSMLDRPRIVVLNKIDVPEGRDLADLVKAELRERGLAVYEVSAATTEGLRELKYAMAEIVEAARAARPEPVAERVVIRPVAIKDKGFAGGPQAGRRLPDQRRAADPVGQADGLHQRGGDRLPGRPARPPRRRGGPRQGRRRLRRHRADRRRRRRGHLRLGPGPVGRRRRPRGRPRGTDRRLQR